MIGEIINPSDAYTIDCQDEAAACAAVLLLGTGKYGIKGPNDEDILGLFIFGGAEDWFEKKYGVGLGEYVSGEKRLGTIAALESMLIGNFVDRAEYDDAIERMPESKRDEFRKRRHNRRRSSMNDIGKRATALAERLRQVPEAANAT